MLFLAQFRHLLLSLEVSVFAEQAAAVVHVFKKRGFCLLKEPWVLVVIYMYSGDVTLRSTHETITFLRKITYVLAKFYLLIVCCHSVLLHAAFANLHCTVH